MTTARHRTARLGRGLGALLLLATVLASCGPDASPTAPTAPPPSPAPASTAVPAPSPGPSPSRLAMDGGVRLEVGDDLQAVVAMHPPGTRFVIGAGVHRLQELAPRDGDSFVGEPGAILSGARVLGPSAFVRDGKVWVAGDQTQEGAARGEMLPGAERDAHPEDLFVDGERWRHIGSREGVTGAGVWHLDYASDELVLGVDPGSVGTIEVSAAAAAFTGPGVRDVTIENLTVRHYATPSQRGAIDGRHSVGWTIRFVEASGNHAYGLGTGPGMLVEHSRFSDNGQAGVGGPGSRHSEAPVGPDRIAPIRIRSNEIVGNRSLGYNWRWEGGGTKFTVTSGMEVTNSHVHDNGGPGIWFDIDNEDPIACANLVEGNVEGIFPEIGQGATVAWNEVHDNLRRGEEDASVGIYVSNTSDVEIFENAVSGQPHGILVRAADERERGRFGPRRSTGLFVHDNRVAFDDHSGIRLESSRPEEAATARFEGNTWFVPEVDGRWWILGPDSDRLDWAAWQALGMDEDGAVLVQDGPTRPRLPDGVPRFTPTHYGPLAAGQAVPAPPAAVGCAAMLRDRQTDVQDASS